MYDYGARNYDPALGRWMNIDLLAEKAPGWTPYRAFFNNPLKYIDPTGMFEDWVEHDGLMTWDSNVQNQEDAVRYYGKDAKYHAPNAYGSYDKKGDYTLYSDDGKFVKNGTEYQAPDRAVNTNAKKEAYKKAETANKAASAVSAGSGVKDVLIVGAVALGSNNKINNLSNEVITATSGSGVAKYLKYSKNAGAVLGVVSTVYSANETRIQYQAGGMGEVLQHRDVYDTGVGALGIVGIALGATPVGWGIGIGCLSYGAGCLIYDAVTEEKK